MTLRRGGLLACAALLAVLSPNAFGCGVCVEDKVAATYDHAVVSRALSRGHVMVFAGLNKTWDQALLTRDLKRAAERSPGVERGSVRVSTEVQALSFALDPDKQSPEATISALEKSVRRPGLKLIVLKVAR